MTAQTDPDSPARGRAIRSMLLSTAMLAAALLGSAGCVSRRAGSAAARDAAAEVWPPTRALAQEFALGGRHAQADSMLAAFAMAHKGTAQARDAAFWRAVYQLDPANPTGLPRLAKLLLDEYLADPHTRPHTAEALVLRRLTVSIDSLDQLVRGGARATGERIVVVDRTKTDELEKEVKTLREQLERANAELQRIRDRLRPQRPPNE